MLRNPAYGGVACFGKTRVAAEPCATPFAGAAGGHTEQCQSRTPARGLDRDPGAGA